MIESGEHSSKRIQILDAAQRRFAHYGVSKVTMEDVAADLGISKASVYYYFKTKEDVFREVIRREREEFTALVAAIVDSAELAEEKLRQYVRQRLQLINRHANVNVLGVQAWLEAKPIIRDVLEEFMVRELQLVRRILEAGAAAGELSVGDPEKTSRLILDACLGLVKQNFQTFNEFSNFEEQFSRLQEETELFVTYMVNGMKTRCNNG